MGVLIDGVWTDGTLPEETGKTGEFKRKDSSFRNWITADGSSGFKAEAGRYHLYVAHACPWAHRTLIYRAIKKLEGAITVAYSVPGIRAQGWTFQNDPKYPDCTPDTVNGFNYLHQAYTAADPKYTGKVTVPTLWDKKTKTIVNNELSEIIRMLNSEFNAVGGDNTDYYPKELRAEIDRINELTYVNVNNGVYRAGFAKSQDAYEAAYDGCSPRSMSWRRGLPSSAIWSASRSPRPTGGCCPRCCASTSPISRSSSATSSGSPTIRTCRTTCSTSTTCRASPRR